MVLCGKKTIMKRIVRSGIIIATTLLASKVAALEVYSPAPDFTAPSTMGEMTAFQNNIARFGDLNVQILGVSSTRWKATRPFLINSVSASPSLLMTAIYENCMEVAG